MKEESPREEEDKRQRGQGASEMSELCHVCDLFRTALFGPTNTEDHLDDGLGNDLPRPMADAPATMDVR